MKIRPLESAERDYYRKLKDLHAVIALDLLSIEAGDEIVPGRAIPAASSSLIASYYTLIATKYTIETLSNG